MPNVDVADIELKFIKTTLSSKRAFRTAQGIINGYNFTHPYLTWLWTEITSYAKRTGHKPGPEFVEVLMDSIDEDMLPRARAYQEAMEETDCTADDLEFYIDQLINRQELQTQLEAINLASKALENGDTKASKKYLATAAIVTPGVKPRTQAGLSFVEQKAEYIPTGLAALDYHIDGLGKGECGLVMGVTGIGKSVLATNFCYGALKQRWQVKSGFRRVWHIDTENGERIVKCRHISRFTGISDRALEKDRLTTYQTKRVNDWLERNDERIAQQLFIYPAEFLGTSWNDIEREMVQLEATGNKPDELIFDSPDHLMEDTKNEQARWERFAEIYTKGRAFAQKYNVALWMFTQAKLEYENKTATNAAVADSKEKARMAHIVLSINQEPDDPQKRFVYVAKNRTGSCRFKIALNIDWDRMRVSTLGHPLDRPTAQDADDQTGACSTG